MLYDSLYRHVVFPLIERMSGRNLPKHLRRLSEELSLPKDVIAVRQNQLLSRMVSHACATSPYWRETFRAHGVDPQSIQESGDLPQIPIMEKYTVRTRLEDVSSKTFVDSRKPATTGGSTAAPTRFYRNPLCLAFREAVRAHYWQCIGKPPTTRWANVWGASIDFDGYRSTRALFRERYLRRVLIFPANHLSEKSAPRFFDQLNRFRPVLLHGYSQALLLLAKMADQLKLQLPDSIVAVTATAEPLHDEQKKFVSRVFQIPVYRVYGTREFGFIGGELPGRVGLQINPLNAIVEIVDEAGQPVQPGKLGQILVTDLQNLATPFIRYRIGDMGSWLEHSTTEHRFLALNIDAGRETDFIVSNDGRFISGAALTLIGSKEVDQLQYIQQRNGDLQVRYVCGEQPTSACLIDLANQIRRVVGALEISFQRVQQIPRTPSGKLQYVCSEAGRQAVGISGPEKKVEAELE